MELISATANERGVLRWGGLAGMLGGALMLVVFAIVGTFVGADPAQPEGLIARFPGIRAARIVENGLYLGVLVLWAVQAASLFQALRGPSLAAALVGRTLATFGLILVAAGALVHIGTAPISELYHAPGTPVVQQSALVPLWLAVQGIYDSLLVAGLLVLPLGVTAFGWAMRSSPAYGRAAGWLTIGLGLAAFTAAVVNLVEMSEILAVAVFALIGFNLVIGWKTFQLSREPRRALQVAAMMAAS